MNVCLIKASAKSEFSKYKRAMGGPPQNIFSVAAATPAHVNVEMIDETIGMKVRYNTNAKLVVLFMSTPDAPAAYKHAAAFKKRGKTVVFGGLHASFLPEEALQHGNAVLIGEAEEIWETLLNDFENGQLKKRYQRSQPFDLAGLKPYPTHHIHSDKYDGIWSVVVSRGCPHHCAYCTVTPFFKNIRYRPVKDVVEEIKHCGTRYIELHADNLIADKAYAKALFTALIPLNIIWLAETTIKLAEDEELLALAAKSGLKYLLLGLETPSKAALKAAGKAFVPVDKIKAYLAVFHRYGVEIDSSFLFGFDEHGPEIFQETLDFAKEIEIDQSHSVLLIPFPGTQTYRQMGNSGRLLTSDWSKYDGVHGVFKPKQMSAKALEEGAWWFDREFNKWAKKRKKNNAITLKSQATGKRSAIKWKTLLGLILILISMGMDWQWPYGVLFIGYAISDIRMGRTYLLEDVLRTENPIIYWITVVAFLMMGAAFFL